MIYFDLRKALDFRLLCKLNEFGISGKLHSCIQSPLNKKMLWVSVGEGYPKCIEVASGVPQGFALLLLFIIDCLNCLLCDMVMFADNVKWWWAIEGPSNVQSPQNDIDHLLRFIQMNVLFLGCILGKRRTVIFSIT